MITCSTCGCEYGFGPKDCGCVLAVESEKIRNTEAILRQEAVKVSLASLTTIKQCEGCAKEVGNHERSALRTASWCYGCLRLIVSDILGQAALVGEVFDPVSCPGECLKHDYQSCTCERTAKFIAGKIKGLRVE